MKKLIFVSTGRCGTRRLYEIFKEKLPEEKFAVVHQVRFSRLADVIGNLMYYLGDSRIIKKILYKSIIQRYDKKENFISTDPLTAMVIPEEYIKSENVCIIHIVRNRDSFARSMFNFSRQKWKSFIAHNFIPLWQPGIYPLENILNKNIKKNILKQRIKKINGFVKHIH